MYKEFSVDSLKHINLDYTIYYTHHPEFLFFFFLMIRPPPNSPLFPHTPLSRSELSRGANEPGDPLPRRKTPAATQLARPGGETARIRLATQELLVIAPHQEVQEKLGILLGLPEESEYREEESDKGVPSLGQVVSEEI